MPGSVPFLELAYEVTMVCLDQKHLVSSFWHLSCLVAMLSVKSSSFPLLQVSSFSVLILRVTSMRLLFPGPFVIRLTCLVVLARELFSERN